MADNTIKFYFIDAEEVDSELLNKYTPGSILFQKIPPESKTEGQEGTSWTSDKEFKLSIIQENDTGDKELWNLGFVGEAAKEALKKEMAIIALTAVKSKNEFDIRRKLDNRYLSIYVGDPQPDGSFIDQTTETTTEIKTGTKLGTLKVNGKDIPIGGFQNITADGAENPADEYFVLKPVSEWHDTTSIDQGGE